MFLKKRLFKSSVFQNIVIAHKLGNDVGQKLEMAGLADNITRSPLLLTYFFFFCFGLSNFPTFFNLEDLSRPSFCN